MTPAALEIRFADLWRRLAATGDPLPIARDLLARWSGPERHYHSLAHLVTCLTTFDTHRSQATDADTVEAALWFHDAIYDPRAPDNEIRSADLATTILTSGSVPESDIEKVRRLILATRTHEADSDSDTALLLDIDLAILGASPAVYQTYADAIRREYAWVPASDYRAKRTAILTRFLQRPRLFLTEPFFVSQETPARANLAREIRALA